MRYLIQFADRTSMIVPEREGKAMIIALSEDKKVTIRGALINPRFVSIIKPIERGWFKSEFVEDQRKIELRSPDSIKLIGDYE